MGKDYVDEADPGPLMVELAVKLIENLDTINVIRFVKHHKEVPNNAIGVFMPTKKEVLIDLGHVLHNTDMYRYGCMFIPGVYYTALWALFHEVAHGQQVAEEPQLIKLHNLYEHAAQQEAHDCVRIWASENSLPPLNEWGWLGEQISDLANSRYTKGDLSFIDEIDLMREGACANFEMVTNAWQFERPTDIIKEILDGHYGMKIGTHYYLSAIDFFGLDTPETEVVQSAQAVLMK